MAHEFEFPDVGEGVTEGTLIKWLVAEGDAVEEDESLAEVETDKAIVEVPSPKTATILTLHAEEGDTIKVGEVLVTLGEEGEEAPAADEAEAAEEEPAEEEAEEASEEPAEESGEAEEEPAAEEEEPASAEEEESEEAEEEAEEPEHRESTSIVGELEEAPDEPAEAAEPDEPAAEAEEETGEPQETEGRTLATPSTRRLAREKDVAIDMVKGTGPGGRVTKEDVERAAEGGTPAKPEPEAPAEEAAAPEPEAPAGRRFEPKEYDFAKWGAVERTPMSGTRKAIARAMERSKYTAPHVTHTDDADVTELWAVRKKEKHIAEEKGVHLTFLPFIVKACISALKDYPRMNSSLDETTQELVRKDYYNIGVAVATDDGLLVPNVKDADEKSILALGREMNELAQQARGREISLEQMRGGTFTITNYGSIGGRYGTPIINYPEVGILGVGTIRDEPVVKGENVKVRKILPLSLSFDHRVIDGAYAAQFMNEVIAHLEDPDLLMIDE